MKIVNIESGKPYQLSPDTELSVERTNPFFHDYGEQTLPVALPDSPYNRMLLNQIGSIERKDKIGMIDVSIEDGDYYSVCRQAVLAVTPDESIDTSFYMNDGSFYSRLEDTLITEVFADEVVPGINSVEDAITWMTQLWKEGEKNDKYACFAVEISEKDNSSIYLNHYKVSEDAFYHSVERTESIEERKVVIPAGFYLTPFLKVLYVLRRLFAHYGYTLKENFISRDKQLSNLVFINNVADAIVNGEIRLAQLLPKVSCKQILDLLRKKFCCEFVTDEASMTVDIVTFNDVIKSANREDLTPFLVGKLKINYPEGYRRISLKSKSTVAKESSSAENLEAVKKQNPTVRFSEELGVFYRDGFIYSPISIPTRQIVCDTDQLYSEGGKLEEEEIEIPECIPAYSEHEVPFIGEVQWLNSSLRTGTPSENQEIPMEEKEAKDTMDLMLAFVCNVKGITMGTITNYAIYRNSFFNPSEFIRIGDYSLVYNGVNGIFEKFYRGYDTLLRNSLHTAEGEMLLPQKNKRSLSSIQKVVVGNSEFFISTLSFKLGQKKSLTQIKLLTTNLYDPVNTAKKISDIIPEELTNYHWEGHCETCQITQEDFDNSPYKNCEIPNIYPQPAKQEDVGKRSYLRKAAYAMEVEGKPTATTWWSYTFWLEAVPNV